MVRGTGDIDDWQRASVAIHYFPDPIDPIDERTLRVYRWDEGQSAWQPLSSMVDQEHNFAAALLEGYGVYALMSGGELLLPYSTYLPVVIKEQ